MLLQSKRESEKSNQEKYNAWLAQYDPRQLAPSWDKRWKEHVGRSESRRKSFQTFNYTIRKGLDSRMMDAHFEEAQVQELVEYTELTTIYLKIQLKLYVTLELQLKVH